MMVLVRDLNDFANRHLHSRNRFHFASIGEGLGCIIVATFGIQDSRAHVINPGRNEFLFHVVVALNRHALKREILHLAVGARHFHGSGKLAQEETTIHYRFSCNTASGRRRSLARSHHFYGVTPGTSEIGEDLVIFVELRHLHHLLHHLRWVRRGCGCRGRRDGRGARLWSRRLGKGN